MRRGREEARRDLAAINAAIRRFPVEPGAEHVASYMDVYRLFKHGEQFAICKAALASEGPLSTPELALRVMRAKGMAEADRVLRKAVMTGILDRTLELAGQRNAIAAPFSSRLSRYTALTSKRPLIRVLF